MDTSKKSMLAGVILGAGVLTLSGCESLEHKCGEGKCGEKTQKADAKCGEGKCGAKKATEGKCGEGKCGAKKKKKEAYCGEGKCGAKK